MEVGHNLQLVYREEEVDPDLLCTSSPLPVTGGSSSDGVIQKVKEIQDCVEISCEGFEEQFMALLISIEAGHSFSPKFVSCENIELKQFTCLINYDGSEGSANRGRSKGNVVFSH